MKKLLIVFAVVFGMAACGEDSSNSTTNGTDSAGMGTMSNSSAATGGDTVRPGQTDSPMNVDVNTGAGNPVDSMNRSTSPTKPVPKPAAGRK